MMGDVTAGERRVSRWRIIGWGIAVALILTPLIAMRFTSEVNWTAFDFVFAIVMIGGVGLLVELTVRMTKSWPYRGGIAIALAACFLLIWINGAVGIIGDEDNPANLMFLGVILLALLGAVIALFRPRGMARAMAVAAAAQVGVGIVALAGNMGAGSPAWPFDVALSSVFFTIMWTAAAALFHLSAQRQATS